jgi:hypothetical protein
MMPEWEAWRTLQTLRTFGAEMEFGSIGEGFMPMRLFLIQRFACSGALQADLLGSKKRGTAST